MKEFKVGSLYKSKCAGIVVKCTKDKCDVFEGIVVDSNLYSSYENGHTSSHWLKNNFEEHLGLKDSTEITLQNGHKYNIPKGCKATVTGDVIEIEEDVTYRKCSFRLSTAYVKLSKTPTIVVIDNSGSCTIKNVPIAYTNSTPVEDITKEEFEKAYKEAMETLKL